MNTNSTAIAPAATSTPAPETGTAARQMRSTLWWGLCLAVVATLYVVTERSAWFQELPVLVGAFGRINAVALVLGLFAVLNPWKAGEDSRR